MKGEIDLESIDMGKEVSIAGISVKEAQVAVKNAVKDAVTDAAVRKAVREAVKEGIK